MVGFGTVLQRIKSKNSDLMIIAFYIGTGLQTYISRMNFTFS
mgnify:CR=1 FL=1